MRISKSLGATGGLARCQVPRKKRATLGIEGLDPRPWEGRTNKFIIPSPWEWMSPDTTKWGMFAHHMTQKRSWPTNQDPILVGRITKPSGLIRSGSEERTRT